MKRVGEVVRTAQGLAIARCPEGTTPEIGTVVIDEDLTEVGRVVDVFGPVSRPYVAVTPEDRTGLPALLGGKLYAR
ncbi:H/ACA ribonucleoprotein complex subunit GAR1 [Halalkalicoccus jeotgali]|uniref:H/ACA RNA-protein complex component Gar1 n=1 Tax=Halalkalicoccus jeotgali (strain DSM 18796 / CECT 7217 / JCM 14584 / KCTC 4019 / B3) TaxID=795797 RepID=D8J2S1_HALJB|nr:Gar1/Naf1 family protein [Halalkalicoccus jeotgali]ADJ15028.1 H/ACA RNA-protein complex component Gar1 [Halalkalicoccus jeotgali B3]ELY34954.1 H/ACA RNA-protein complex component Gar1 [Halalkalicoccus jeotgali B3]